MTDFKEMLGQVSASVEDMKKTNAQINEQLKIAATGAADEAKAAIKIANELAQKQQGMANALTDIEQKLADGVRKGDKAAADTLGKMVVKSDAFKRFANGETNKFRIEANTITGQEGSPAVNSDTLVAPQRLAGIISGAFRSLRVQDVLPNYNTTSNAVEYTKELLFTNNAAETAEGATKPESVLTFELATANVATIAHFLKVSKQVLEDASALESYIDTRLRYGVDLRYENQLLNGNGTGQNISGITKSGNFTAFTPVTGDNALDSINRAIENVLVADYAPTAIMLNPADWHAIERLKVGTSDNRYVIGNPSGMMGPNMWGLPVVVTNAMTSGKLLVGAFDISHGVFNRSGTVVEMFEQDDTNVQKNLITVRAERRGTLATFRAASVQYGNLTL